MDDRFQRMTTLIEVKSRVRLLQRRVAPHVTLGPQDCQTLNRGQAVAVFARRCSTGAPCLKTLDERVEREESLGTSHADAEEDSRDGRMLASDSTLGGGRPQPTLLGLVTDSAAHNMPTHGRTRQTHLHNTTNNTTHIPGLPTSCVLHLASYILHPTSCRIHHTSFL